MKLVLNQLPGLRGTIRMPYLAPEAALALRALEKDTDGLIYTDMWRDPTASLLARRTRRTAQLPGYSGHNYGYSVDLNVGAILNEKKILYEDLLHLMKKRGWLCQRRDGDQTKSEADHFNYLGDEPSIYMYRCTQDPSTWQSPAELIIMEKFGEHFQLDMKDVQELLMKAQLFTGAFTGQNDPYTREAILAFQRAWDLTQTGMADLTTCRVLAFVTAERELGQLPAWVASSE